MIPVARLALSAVVAAAALCSLSAGAQQVYRIVGPDGKVTFSDRPPPDAKATPAGGSTAGGASGASGAGGAALPFELRTIASKYPVTIYTGADCPPCVSGRTFLASRGIPFNERTVTTEDDVEALKRMAGAPRLPLLTIGGQQLRGFSETEWASFLDAAGYPRTSALPSGWRNAPATPLVATQSAPRTPVPQAQPEAAPQAGAEPAAASTPTPPPNPAGIRF